MKKSSFAIMSMLAVASPAFGQSAATFVSGSSGTTGTHQLSIGGELQQLSLCTHEICFLDEAGKLQIAPVAASSMSAIISQASEPNGGKYLVFYPVGEERNPKKRRVLRNRFVVELSEDADLDMVKQRCGIKSIRRVSGQSRLAVCEEESAGKVLGQLSNVLLDPDVVAAEPIFARSRYKRLIPSDPFYNTTADPDEDNPSENPREDEAYQWYLNNEGVNGGVADIDINLEAALERATGQGVTVAVLDDGLAIDHVDLAVNAVGPHLNLLDGDPGDPATLDPNLNHGTNVAGLIAAQFNNAEGISGVAPNASLAGIRLLSGALGGLIDDADEAQALNYENGTIQIYNSSWGTDDTTLNLEGPGRLAAGALRSGIENGRPDPNNANFNLGSIFVWAAGNGGAIGDNSNYDGYASSKFTIAVGAVDDSGSRAAYSERGSNLVVVAPSSGGALDVLTTSFDLGVDQDDNPIRIPEYDPGFTGTSASAALVSGVVALMLEENPSLSWRDVQDILIRTAVKVDPSNGEWITNAAGLEFNENYGAGMVDALAAVSAALAVGNDNTFLPEAVDPYVKSRFFLTDADPNSPDNGSVPDNNGESLLIEFDMTQTDDEVPLPLPNLKVEHVELSATIITERRSDLEIVLISPNGTESALQTPNPDNDEQSIFRWNFMTTRNWGEGSAGSWVVRITDQATGNPAIVNNMSLVVNGSVDPTAPVGSIPLLISTRFLNLDQGSPFTYRVETTEGSSVEIGDLPPGVSYDSLTRLISGTPTEPGLYSVPVRVFSDTTDDGLFTLNIVVNPTAVALGDAVGLPDQPAFFGGALPWNFELVDTNDGDVDEPRAARSAVNLDDGQQSIFGFDNLPRGVIMFDWKTSSEEGADRLWFNRSGQVPQVWDAFISGEREWGRTAIALPNVSNNVRWIYAKDAAGSEGEDLGLVDNVEIVEAEKFMDDIRQAANVEGLDLLFTSRTLFMPFEISNASPSPDGTEELIRSSTIGNGQTASLSATMQGPGRLNFVAGNYGEAADLLEFLVDGVVVDFRPGAGPGNTNIRFMVTNRVIPAGQHRIEIRYVKSFRGSDSRVNDGELIDGILIDDLKYFPDDNFNAFAAQYGSGLDLEPGSDSDSDGYSNFDEYAFGGNMIAPDVPRYLPRVIEGATGSFIEYGIDPSRLDLEYIPQQSRDLENWEAAELASLDRTEGNIEVYQIPIASGPGRNSLFYRVVARPK